ncbi:unnamed protein product [Trifolium pratense]|uniref:Uncharacterized protein n=1 Tax=Trifolium pratense TaxID=57577 RepID=A0ACB0LD57_TRIPR|nr:unnamed protein product [Trifolium pratense]
MRPDLRDLEFVDVRRRSKVHCTKLVACECILMYRVGNTPGDTQILSMYNASARALETSISSANTSLIVALGRESDIPAPSCSFLLLITMSGTCVPANNL